jgi:hypothetical protein
MSHLFLNHSADCTRRRQGVRCITVEVSETDVAALVARYFLSEEERHDPAAIKGAIEGLVSDMVFEFETERSNHKQFMKRVTARQRDA